MRYQNIVGLFFVFTTLAGCASAPNQTLAPTEQRLPATSNAVESIDWNKLVLSSEEIIQNFELLKASPNKSLVMELYSYHKSKFANTILPPPPPPPSAEEFAAIDLYKKQAGYWELNSYLRGNPIEKFTPETLLAWAKLMVSGLNQFKPELIAANVRVYRGAQLNREAARTRYKKGVTVTEQSFVSSSTQKTIASVFAQGAEATGKVKTLLSIESKTGRYITTGYEAEVLFRPSTRFHVNSYTETTDDWILISLKEIQ